MWAQIDGILRQATAQITDQVAKFLPGLLVALVLILTTIVEAVLSPGDTVVADSLQRDWYRVAFQGEVMGYAHRSTLTTAGH